MIKLSAVGDIALFGEYDEIINSKGYQFPFSLISKHFLNSDIVLGNLEAPLSNKGKPDSSKPISLRGSPRAISSLVECGITHLSLANNHSFDFGKLAIIDTQKRLGENGISSFGFGSNLNEARMPLIEKFDDFSLAFLAYNSYTTNGRKIASKNSYGISPLNYNHIKSDIDLIKYKNKNTKIIISLHWGVEMSSYPTPFQSELAKKLIDDGVDIIIGHHPHVIQGVQEYNNGIIVYSLGNFCFPNVNSPNMKGSGYILAEENKEAVIFDCEISSKGIDNYKTTPFIINKNLQPELVSGIKKKRIIERLTLVSRPLYNNYPEFYKDKIVNSIPKNGLLSKFNRLGVFGIIKRINLMYLRAYLIAFINTYKEKKHKALFYKRIKV